MSSVHQQNGPFFSHSLNSQTIKIPLRYFFPEDAKLLQVAYSTNLTPRSLNSLTIKIPLRYFFPEDAKLLQVVAYSTNLTPRSCVHRRPPAEHLALCTTQQTSSSCNS